MARVGLTLPLPGLALPDHASLLPELEDMGYEDFWTRETFAFDALTPLAFAAACTRRARLGSAVAVAPVRGPALLAMEAAALCDAAPGRFVLGIGSSSPTVVGDWNARPFARPRTALHDTLRFLRAALSGERVDRAFETFEVRGFRLAQPPPAPPPIVLAALRERMLALAAAEADGAVLGMLTADDVARVVRQLRPGQEVVARIPVCVTPDAERARAAARRMLVPYLCVPVYARFHAWLGRGELLAPLQRAWREGDRDAALAAFPDSLLDAMFVHGPPEACAAQLRRFLDAGVTTLVLALEPHGWPAVRAARALAPFAAQARALSAAGSGASPAGPRR